ncbi:L-glyceraldehyde 3-phosphate reductase [Corynebacterium faecale]|uniref:aldo/keto reductase n=1 Tax=Corynebacterium faecale TaxID=1758466 RepID=UPI0025B2A6AF|nr:aldo/keto reductase [Corynebacterium faecale]WJY90950.1 L-glyceraldehyde 3-phosphate reductase [Corynebacterium faecale]
MVHIKGTDFDIFPLNLGGNTFGWTTDQEQSFAVLDAFRDAGGNFVDTADMYSAWADGNEGGDSEKVLGAYLKARGGADDLIIATKSGALEPHTGRSRDATFAAVDASRARLGVETIDIFYYHHDDETISIEDQIATAEELIAAGKIKHLALSNYSPERLREFFEKSADSTARPVAVQPQYNLLTRHDYETGIRPIVEEFGPAVFPYFALASGLLTGKYSSKEDLEGRARAGFAEGQATDEAFALITELRAVADELDSAPATVALAWLLAKGVTAPIASATSPDQLPELMAAPTLKLDDAHLTRLDAASAP